MKSTQDLLAEIYEFNNLCCQLEKLIEKNPILGLAAHYRFRSGLIDDRPSSERDNSGRQSKHHKKLRSMVANSRRTDNKPGSSVKGNGKSKRRSATIKTDNSGNKRKRS